MKTREKKDLESPDFREAALLFGSSVLLFLIWISLYLYKVDVNANALLFVSIFLVGVSIISRRMFLLGMLGSSLSAYVVVRFFTNLTPDDYLWYSGYLAVASAMWFAYALVRFKVMKKK